MGEYFPPELVAQLRSMPEPDFDCVVCGHTVKCAWNPRGKDRQIPPICNSCERINGYAWHGRARHRTGATRGFWMDRRNAMRIDALADALAQEANHQQWRMKHGRP